MPNPMPNPMAASERILARVESVREVRVRVPAKINLALRVSGLKDDGFHDVATIYHAVSLYDEVVAVPYPTIEVETHGVQASEVPDQRTNLAARAARLLARHVGIDAGVHLTIVKKIPVAGGMAGGSADAAAALLACDHLWNLDLGKAELSALAARLGSDVPFSLSGGTAIGTGRGDQLTPVLARGTYNWVVALADEGLSTPAVYAEIDRLREGRRVPSLEIPDRLMQALRRGDPHELGRHLINDLQPAALSLAPNLARTLEVGLADGALGGIVSGSGPSVVFLVEDAERALDLSLALSAAKVCRDVVRVTGPVHGARLIESVRG